MAATLHAQDQNVDLLGCSSALPVSAGSTGDPGGATALANQCDGDGDANTAAACLALGAMYEEGKGVPRDEALARKLYDRACQGGLATGCALRDRDRDRAGGGDGAATSK
jgi:TPR repeat protein